MSNGDLALFDNTWGQTENSFSGMVRIVASYGKPSITVNFVRLMYLRILKSVTSALRGPWYGKVELNWARLDL